MSHQPGTDDGNFFLRKAIEESGYDPEQVMHPEALKSAARHESKKLCPECAGEGDYWTEWSDAAEQMAQRGEIFVVVNPNPPDGTVCIQCHVCKGSGEVDA